MIALVTGGAATENRNMRSPPAGGGDGPRIYLATMGGAGEMGRAFPGRTGTGAPGRGKGFCTVDAPPGFGEAFHPFRFHCTVGVSDQPTGQ